MKKKYLVIGGYVTSKNDGDRHYVSSYVLARLYGLNPKDCFLAEENNERSLLGIRFEDYIILRPRYDGNSKLED